MQGLMKVAPMTATIAVFGVTQPTTGGLAAVPSAADIGRDEFDDGTHARLGPARYRAPIGWRLRRRGRRGLLIYAAPAMR